MELKRDGLTVYRILLDIRVPIPFFFLCVCVYFRLAIVTAYATASIAFWIALMTGNMDKGNRRNCPTALLEIGELNLFLDADGSPGAVLACGHAHVSAQKGQNQSRPVMSRKTFDDLRTNPDSSSYAKISSGNISPFVKSGEEALGSSRLGTSLVFSEHEQEEEDEAKYSGTNAKESASNHGMSSAKDGQRDPLIDFQTSDVSHPLNEKQSQSLQYATRLQGKRSMTLEDERERGGSKSRQHIKQTEERSYDVEKDSIKEADVRESMSESQRDAAVVHDLGFDVLRPNFSNNAIAMANGQRHGTKRMDNVLIYNPIAKTGSTTFERVLFS